MKSWLILSIVSNAILWIRVVIVTGAANYLRKCLEIQDDINNGVIKLFDNYEPKKEETK